MDQHFNDIRIESDTIEPGANVSLMARPDQHIERTVRVQRIIVERGESTAFQVVAIMVGPDGYGPKMRTQTIKTTTLHELWRSGLNVVCNDGEYIRIDLLNTSNKTARIRLRFEGTEHCSW